MKKFEASKRNDVPEPQSIGNFIYNSFEYFTSPEKRIAHQLEKLKSTHQEMHTFQTNLKGFDEYVTSLKDHQEYIAKTCQEAGKALEAFEKLQSKPENYKRALTEYDQKARMLAHEISAKQQAPGYSTKSFEEIELLQQRKQEMLEELFVLSENMKSNRTLAEQYNSRLEEHKKISDELQERLEAPEDTHEVRLLKERFRKLESPDFKIQVHHYSLGDAMFKVIDCQEKFAEIKHAYAQYTNKLSESEKAVALLDEKLGSNQAPEIQEKTQELLIALSKMYKDFKKISDTYEKNEKAMQGMRSLRKEVSNLLDSSFEHIKDRSLFYPVDLAEPYEDPKLNALEITRPGSCVVYSTRSLLRLMDIPTTEADVSVRFQLGKDGNEQRGGVFPKDAVDALNEHYAVNATLHDDTLRTERVQMEIQKGYVFEVGVRTERAGFAHGIGIIDTVTDRTKNQTFYAVYDNVTRHKGSCMLVPDYYINHKAYCHIIIEPL